jgi:hypothetical protein
VTLAASGLPSGAVASFSLPSLTSSASSTLKVSTVSSTPAGTYTLTVTGRDGSRAHSTCLTLVVENPASPSSRRRTAPAMVLR